MIIDFHIASETNMSIKINNILFKIISWKMFINIVAYAYETLNTCHKMLLNKNSLFATSVFCVKSLKKRKTKKQNVFIYWKTIFFLISLNSLLYILSFSLSVFLSLLFSFQTHLKFLFLIIYLESQVQVLWRATFFSLFLLPFYLFINFFLFFINKNRKFNQ